VAAAEAGTLAGAAATLATGANNPYSGVQLKYLTTHSLAYTTQADSFEPIELHMI